MNEDVAFSGEMLIKSICVQCKQEKNKNIKMYRVKKQNLQLITYRGIQNVLKTRCVTNLKLRNTYIHIDSVPFKGTLSQEYTL